MFYQQLPALSVQHREGRRAVREREPLTGETRSEIRVMTSTDISVSEAEVIQITLLSIELMSVLPLLKPKWFWIALDYSRLILWLPSLSLGLLLLPPTLLC